MSEIHYIDQNADQSAAQLELLKSQVQNISDENQLMTYITQLENNWSLGVRGDRCVALTNCFRIFYSPEQLGSDGFPTDMDLEGLSGKHTRKREALGELWNKAKSLGIITSDSVDINGNNFDINQRIWRLIRLERNYFHQVMNYGEIDDAINRPTVIPLNPDADLTENTMEDRSPYQNLLLALLDELYEKKYRRYKGHCCVQIQTPTGFNTRAWKPVMSIQDFVYHTCQKEYNPNMWLDLTAKSGNARDSAKYLNDCRDMQFPDIEKKRHVWSFNNGVFVGKCWIPKDGKYVTQFYPYESKEFTYLDQTIVAAKYFDKQFVPCDHIEDWWDIPTPHFQSIMDYQKFPEEVCKWMYVMGGKLCFDVGDMDSWQIIPFLKGIARSGKSTLITKVFKKFYESEDVRTLSNNIERKFGLSSIYDGFMFIAPEVKGDLCLEQAEFQSLVSGEDVSVARKYENAKSVEWKTPGILGGNEIPNWKDNSGSVLRRILPWNFSKQVMEADPHLDQKLDQELPIILQKCVRGYLDYAQRYSDQDIWNVVPSYFKTIQSQVAMVTNSLQNFLASEKIRFGPELFCPQKVFVQNFNQHCQENNLGKPKFNPDFYAGPFSSRGIEVRTEARTYKGRAFPAQPMIFGVDVIEETLQFGEDY
jgi:hypothetical protein